MNNGDDDDDDDDDDDVSGVLRHVRTAELFITTLTQMTQLIRLIASNQLPFPQVNCLTNHRCLLQSLCDYFSLHERPFSLHGQPANIMQLHVLCGDILLLFGCML